ncbi:MAG: DNA polymerase III subunit delta, partial [Elusimicrobiota bacterium]|nr:DNA polymerase III subunit delta [Elusimicrobiota bacterium]
MPKVATAKLADNIKSGTIAPVYYFTGDDVYRKFDLVKQIKTVLSPDEFNFIKEDCSSSDIGEVICAANTPPAFADRRMIVLNNIDKIRKGSNAAFALERYLTAPLESTCLVVLHNDAKKSKKDKTFEEACGHNCILADFKPLEGAELFSWLAGEFKRRGLIAAGRQIFILMEELAGSDLCALTSEMDKLSLYLAERENKTVREEDIIENMGFTKEENPFALSKAIINCDKKLSLKLAAKMLESGQTPISVLNKISACALKMLRIKRMREAGISQREIISAAGLFPWEGRLVDSSGK